MSAETMYHQPWASAALHCPGAEPQAGRQGGLLPTRTHEWNDEQYKEEGWGNSTSKHSPPPTPHTPPQPHQISGARVPPMLSQTR